MLTKLRARLAKYLECIAGLLAKIGFSPTHVTLLSLLFSFLAFIALYWYRMIALYAFSVLVSGALDALDGVLARITGKETKLGAFLDSTLDRVSDSLIIFPLVVLGYGYELVVMLLVVSLLTSYVRARSESLGLKLEGVGLIERAERVLALVIVVVMYTVNRYVSLAMLYILLALSTATLIHRAIYVVLRLS